ncbi:MAG: hypothetical protein GY711_00795 [bacterium]|nr:hypothetical protein [bacterium]
MQKTTSANRWSARVLLALLLTGLLSSPALATWSIVVIDRRTGEVAVASATCLTGSIRNAIGLVRVGRGVAATQSIPYAANSRRIWDGIGQFFDAVVDDGQHSVQPHPPLGVQSVPAESLQATRWDLSASAGGTARLVLNLGNTAAGSAYHLYASASGTSPGTTLPIGGGLLIPLNRDRLFDLTESSPDHAGLEGFVGLLDATGRAEASLHAPAGALQPLVGSSLSFCAVVGSGSAATLTRLAAFPIVP